MVLCGDHVLIHSVEVGQVGVSRPCVGGVIIIVRVTLRKDFAPYFLHMRWGHARGKVGGEEMLARGGVTRGKV
jgi:hypothetical protein